MGSIEGRLKITKTKPWRTFSVVTSSSSKIHSWSTSKASSLPEQESRPLLSFFFAPNFFFFSFRFPDWFLTIYCRRNVYPGILERGHLRLRWDAVAMSTYVGRSVWRAQLNLAPILAHIRPRWTSFVICTEWCRSSLNIVLNVERSSVRHPFENHSPDLEEAQKFVTVGLY